MIFGIETHVDHMSIHAKKKSMALYVGHMNYKVKILVKIDTFIDSGQTKITNGVTFRMDTDNHSYEYPCQKSCPRLFLI